MQNHLLEHPAAGDLIPGTGGLRKIRWALRNKGKRGGVRVIYFWQKAEEHIYFLTIYAKNEMENLTAEDKRLLKCMVEEW